MSNLPTDVEAALASLAEMPSAEVRDAAVATLREWMDLWVESQIPGLRERIVELEAEKEEAIQAQMDLPV